VLGEGNFSPQEAMHLCKTGIDEGGYFVDHADSAGTGEEEEDRPDRLWLVANTLTNESG